MFSQAQGVSAGPNLANFGIELPRALREFVTRFANYDWQDLAWSLGIVAVALVMGRILTRVALRAYARWAERTDSVIDDAVAQHLAGPLRWSMPALILLAFAGALSMPPEVKEALRHALSIWLILGVGWVGLGLTRVAESVIMHRYDVRVEDNLRARTVYTQLRAFRNIARFLIVLLAFAAVLTTFDGVRVLGAGLLASTGVLGVVIGFAAQRTISMILAGLHIAISQPIRLEDVVIVEGEWGVIEEINLTYVVVRIWDLRRLIVPVNYFTEKPFQNWTRVSADLLGTVELRLDYSVNLAELRAEFERILKQSPEWDGRVSVVQVTDSGEHTMLVRPLMSAKNAGSLWNLRCEVREKLISFVQQRYPGALPRLRGEATVTSAVSS